MKRILALLWPLAIIFVAMGLFWFLKATRPIQAPPQINERVWRVQVEPVRLQSQSPEVELYGRIESADVLKATAPTAAWVAEVRVRDGEQVSAGQVLLTLDERDFDLNLTQAKADIDEIKADIATELNRHHSDQLALEQERELLALAEASVIRQQQLKTQRVGADQALDEAKTARAQKTLAVRQRELHLTNHPYRVRTLVARLTKAQARLKEQQLAYERAVVRAPYSATVAGVEVTAGDQVSRGQTLLSLYADEQLEVRARIPIIHQDEVWRSLATKEQLDAQIVYAGQRIPLQLQRLAGEANASGVDGLFHFADTANPQPRLGQLVTVRLQLDSQNEVVAIPFAAMYGGNRVYVVTDNRLRGHQVTLLGSITLDDDEERLLIQSADLKDGDLLVVTHLPNAIDGLRVYALPTPQ